MDKILSESMSDIVVILEYSTIAQLIDIICCAI